MAPVILEREQERTQLEQDLKSTRCAELLDRPWVLKNEEMVRKFVSVREHLTERRNIFDNTICDRLKEWTARVWREVYNFPSGGVGLASRINTFVDRKFSHMVDLKDGYPVRDCRNVRHRRLLEFIVPIIHPNKPTWITIIIANTIFGALDGRRPVDWGLVFWNLAQKLVAKGGKPKPTSICPFLFHLYHNRNILTKKKDIDFLATHELISYRITLDPELESHPGSEEEDKETKNPETASQVLGRRVIAVAMQPAQEVFFNLPKRFFSTCPRKPTGHYKDLRQSVPREKGANQPRNRLNQMRRKFKQSQRNRIIANWKRKSTGHGFGSLLRQCSTA